ncbi:MAG: hypothetical protein ACTSRZ_08185 [Promethearchaeota archaeon]
MSSCNSAFNSGPNTIIIQAGLFADKKLHAMVEQAFGDDGCIGPFKFEGEYSFLQNFAFIPKNFKFIKLKVSIFLIFIYKKIN